MVQLVIISTCNLNQWSLDFDLNLANIVQSINEAKKAGARFRTGPELEITGYGCEDHFYEEDTLQHAWESIASILSSDITDNILCDIGMPVLHKGVRYNCRIFICNRKIILIRPKLHLANDGNYREGRWFTAWSKRELDTHILPHSIRTITGQHSVPIGNGVIECDDTSIGSETCEELFTPNAPHIEMCLNGVEIIANGSGSHHQLRKLEIRLALIRNATSKSGGAYLYANQQGCDGGRLYYDGCASAYLNGEMISQGSQFSVRDVEVITSVVDLDEIRSFRAAIVSRSNQAATVRTLPFVHVDFNLAAPHSPFLLASAPMFPRLHTPEEEIGFGPACWLWDYLRRSNASGFFLPLSGGADSAATAAIVGIMSHLVVQAVKNGDTLVLSDARRIAGFKSNDSSYTPRDSREFMSRILHTCYMGTSNSSTETTDRAAAIARDIGCYHLHVNIDMMVSAVLTTFSTLTGKSPKYKVHGGTQGENLALQNIQARLRMVFSYLLAQLLPWVRGQHGFLLVLGSANVDEALRGYMTKYDCSSADINPIGGIAKGDLKRFLIWASTAYPFPSLTSVVKAKPTAELEPITETYVQSDEEDMGMTYEELGIFGRLRKIYRCGPVSMYKKLVALWSEKHSQTQQQSGSSAAEESNSAPRAVSPTATRDIDPSASSSSSSSSSYQQPASSTSNPSVHHLATPGLTPSQVAAKVQSFFYYYSVNRHKLTTLTPSYHAENYSPEDNRFDHRQFLYNTKWKRQYETMVKMAKEDETWIGKQGQGNGNENLNQGSTGGNTVRKFKGGEGDGLLLSKGVAQL